MSTLQGRSPYEVWNDKKADLSRIKMFGCDAWVRVINPTKMADKARLCTFLGYKRGLKGCIFEDKITKRIIKSGDAVFYEGNWSIHGIQRITRNSNGEALWSDVSVSHQNVETLSDCDMIDMHKQNAAEYNNDDKNDASSDDDDDTDNDDDNHNLSTESENVGSSNDESRNENSINEEENSTAPRSSNDIDLHLRRSTRSRKPPPRLHDYVVNFGNCIKDVKLPPKTVRRFEKIKRQLDRALRTVDYLSLSTVTPTDGIVEPRSFNEAMNSPQRAEWLKAIREEMDSLLENRTWSLNEVSLPSGRKCVNTKWVFKIKRDENGHIKRFKARLVARGFSQRKGVDYQRTFAPVMQPALLRVLMAIAAEENWEIDQVDIKTAFLYGKLDDDVYIELPDGTIRKLQRAIYGLKQAGRQWYGRFHKSLLKFGLERCKGDPCCYMKADGSLFVMIHVDDAIIFGREKEDIVKLKQALKSEYKISDLGPIKHCLGWEINRDRKNGILTISQRQYIKDVLKRFGMEDCKVVSTPACPNITFRKSMCPQSSADRKVMQDVPYLEAIGSLLYLAICTRPDIAMAISELARFASDPGIEHWKGVKRVMRYLKGTIDYGIKYGDERCGGLHGYVDANYGRCMDTRKSRYGGIIMMNGGPVDWRSKMEDVIALSSMEAEYIGACEMTKLIIWLRQCMAEIGRHQKEATTLKIDNLSAKIFAEEYMVQNRSKHIDTKFHYIREKIAEGMVKLVHQPTKQMPADALTKPLGPTLFKRFRKMMGVVEIY
jgi:Reverse transcriptase (RNA-dependent DNA polymerase)